jgi:hypothetical protein
MMMDLHCGGWRSVRVCVVVDFGFRIPVAMTIPDVDSVSPTEAGHGSYSGNVRGFRRRTRFKSRKIVRPSLNVQAILNIDLYDY